jgi:hypothetical protein
MNRLGLRASLGRVPSQAWRWAVRYIPHLIGAVCNQSPDGAGQGTGQTRRVTEAAHKRVQLFFAQIGVRGTQPADL